jgi:hypothetical protein
MTTVRDIFQLACPACGSDEELRVQIVTWVDVTPDGTVDNGRWDHEWSEGSGCYCDACKRVGTVREFTLGDRPPSATPDAPRASRPVPNCVLCEIAHVLTVRECAYRQIPVEAPGSYEDEIIYDHYAQAIFDAIYATVRNELEPYCEEVMP